MYIFESWKKNQLGFVGIEQPQSQQQRETKFLLEANLFLSTVSQLKTL
jgi:hypothetical protein